MSESFEQYRERVLSYLGDREPMRVLAGTCRRLERLVADVPSRVLTRRPAAEKWSVQEIVAHLADSELAMGWRFRNMVATPGVRLQWWDEHLWSRACQYVRIPVEESLRAFTVLRRTNLRLLRSLAPEQWTCCYGVHDKRGRPTVEEFVRMEAAHDLNHLRQVAALVSREGRKTRR